MKKARIKRFLCIILALCIMPVIAPMTSGAADESFTWEVGKTVDQVLAIPAEWFLDENVTYVWAVKSGSDPLPAGLSISPLSGKRGTVIKVTGTPTATESGTVYIGFIDEGNQHGPDISNYLYSFYYEVNRHVCYLNFLYTDSPAILPSGNVGSAYSVQINAQSCGTPIRFVDGGGVNLLPGLTLSQNGILSGTPTATGTFDFTINASVDTGTHNADSEHRFRITINERIPTTTITVKKTDENGRPLAGATIRMEGNDENEAPRVYTAVSNSEGIATFEVVRGEYVLSEQTAPTGYNATDDKYNIRVTQSGVFIFSSEFPNGTPYQQVTFVNRLIPSLNKDDHFAYMQGYPEGTFMPAKNMTRAEAVVMFSRLLNEKMDMEENHWGIYYPDIFPGAWYANDVCYMHKLGVLAYYSRDARFRPTDPVTRAEFATLAAHFDNLAPSATNKFTDVPNDHWAVRFINSAEAKGWIEGFPDGTFKPEDNITRAQVVTLVNRMLERKADQAYLTANASALPRSYSDIASGHWAYWDVMEASIGHDFTKSGVNETWTAFYK